MSRPNDLSPSISTATLAPDCFTLADYRQGPPAPMPTPKRRVPGVDPLPADPDRWWERAACRGMDTALFFPERGEQIGKVREVCAGCPVRAECLAVAEREGIWGGTSARERRRMRRGELRGVA